jgi:hypothetical protein
LSEKHFIRQSVSFLSAIWNVLPVPGQPWVVIEERDDGLRQVAFSLWNYAENNFLWRHLTLPEKWWITIAGVDNEQALLKIYQSTDNPDDVSYRSLRLMDGSIAKANPNSNQPDTNKVFYPFQYQDGEPDFETVKKFLNNKFKTRVWLGAEYLERDDRIFISFYEGEPANFTNHLVAFTIEGNCILDEELGSNLKGMGLNTFFLTHDTLFFVKNKTELVTFRIV